MIGYLSESESEYRLRKIGRKVFTSVERIGNLKQSLFGAIEKFFLNRELRNNLLKD
jgi:hypothetical protein